MIEYANTTLAVDLGKKKYVYTDAGIPEYWVANLKNSQLHVFRDLVNGTYQTELTLTDGTVSPLAFPKIAISVQPERQGLLTHKRFAIALCSFAKTYSR